MIDADTVPSSDSTFWKSMQLVGGDVLGMGNLQLSHGSLHAFVKISASPA